MKQNVEESAIKTRITGCLVGLVIILAACAPQAARDVAPVTASDPYRLDPAVRPVAQSLELVIDPADAGYSGSARIELEIEEPRKVIRLHATDMTIESVRVSDGAGDTDVGFSQDDMGQLLISGTEAFPAGPYVLSIDFTNDYNVNGEGIFRSESEDGYYVFSQFEAIHAREAFPCFDEPGFKFPWQLTITVPEDQLAITNTPVVSESTGDGMTRSEFAATPALPSYLIAVAVGDFDTVDIPGLSVPARVIVPAGKAGLAAHAVETTPPLLAYLEDYFGQPYPFAKLDLIATFGAFSGAMEHPGAITYSDHILLLDDSASAAQKAGQIRVTAHELAHQWFGNLVTMQWWDDLWLNESFADWMADKTAEHVFPEYKGDLAQLRTILRIMELDAGPTAQPIRHEFKANDNLFDGVFLSYYKGKSVLGMFERAVGPDTFREGVNRYLRQYSRGNAVADDLWNSINAGADFDLARGLATFIDQPGVPLVTVEDLGAGRFRFSQQRLVNAGDTESRPQTWMIPIEYTYRSGGAIKTGKLLLDAPSATVDLGPDVAWIEPNRGQRGYYRWQVPTAMQSRLAADAGEFLSPGGRMGMLSNAWALLLADAIDGDDLFDTLLKLADDPDANVISALLDQLVNIESNLLEQELADAYAEFVRTLLSPALARIGTAPIDGESPDVQALRPRLMLKLADRGRDPVVREILAHEVQRYLDGEIPMSPIVSTGMEAEAQRGDAARFARYRAQLDRVESPSERLAVLSALGSFRDPSAVTAALEFALDAPLKPVELGSMMTELARDDTNQARLRGWAMANDAALRERLPPSTMARVPSSLVRCDAEPLPAVVEFYGDPGRAAPGIERRLAILEAQVAACVALKKREIGSVREYLAAP